MQIIGLNKSAKNLRRRKSVAKSSCYKEGKVLSHEWAINSSLKTDRLI